VTITATVGCTRFIPGRSFAAWCPFGDAGFDQGTGAQAGRPRGVTMKYMIMMFGGLGATTAERDLDTLEAHQP
jgi:hypothetical protein